MSMSNTEKTVKDFRRNTRPGSAAFEGAKSSRFVSPLVKVTRSVVKSVEALGVHTIQLAHTLREITLRRFDEQVIVVVHETVAIANPIEAVADFREY